MSGTGSGKYASLAKLLQRTEWAGDEVLSLCPFHEDSSPSFRFNVWKGLFICFACGEKGAAAKLAKKLGTIISDDVQLGDLRYAMQALRDIEEPHKQEVKSERSLGRFMGPPHVAWRRRGFSNHTVKKFGLGYDPMNDNLTIPYRNSAGELLGVVTRRIGAGYPKYLYPKGFPRNTNLYGAHMVEGIETVALVEGSLDAVWCWQNDIPAVGQWGSSLSEFQVEILREMGVKSVVLLHDFDLAGRKGAFQAYRALSDFIRITPTWDEEKYCWHEWLCGCKKRGKPGHTMLKAVTCPDRKSCRCGKIHGADPGSLTGDELKALVPQKFRITDATRFVSQLKFHEAENRRSNPRKN